MIAFINIVVLMTMLGHRKYQYLFCREIQGKIICPHECPFSKKPSIAAFAVATAAPKNLQIKFLDGCKE